MTWPEAFAIVGGGAAFVGFWWVLMWGATRQPQARGGKVGPPPSVRGPGQWVEVANYGPDRQFMPGWKLDDIINDPDGYVTAVREAYPKAPRNTK